MFYEGHPGPRPAGMCTSIESVDACVARTAGVRMTDRGRGMESAR